MRTPFMILALSACMLCLVACDKTPATPPKPKLDRPGPTEPGAWAAAKQRSHRIAQPGQTLQLARAPAGSIPALI